MIVGSRRPRPRPSGAGEAGASTIGTVAGVAVFLTLLLFAVQVLVGLYATSTVVAASHDAARRVASISVDHGDPQARAAAVRNAENQLRSLLGEIGHEARIDWSFEDRSVRLHIVTEAPAILPSAIRDSTGLRTIDRTITVRIEEGPR